jgi:hypothetical protein
MQPRPAFSFPTERVAVTWFRVYSMPPEPDDFAVPHFSFFWVVCSGRESQQFFDAPAAHRHTGLLSQLWVEPKTGGGLIMPPFAGIGPPPGASGVAETLEETATYLWYDAAAVRFLPVQVVSGNSIKMRVLMFRVPCGHFCTPLSLFCVICPGGGTDNYAPVRGVVQ